MYAFERCPFRDAAHAVADRSGLVRGVARALWPAARWAERVEITHGGIEAWTLTGRTCLAWDEIVSVRAARTPLGRRSLRIRGSEGRIVVARLIPGSAELERRVVAATA